MSRCPDVETRHPPTHLPPSGGRTGGVHTHALIQRRAAGANTGDHLLHRATVVQTNTDEPPIAIREIAVNATGCRRLLALLVFSLAGTLAAARPPVLAPGAHVSGGIGTDDRRDMRTSQDPYNLRLSFAEAGTGAYVTGVTVTIEPLTARPVYGPYMDTGPLFNIVLAPGAYRVNVAYAGMLQSRKVNAGKDAASLTFYWPARID